MNVTQMKRTRAQRVELEGCSNFRDLGGYRLNGGGTTKSGVLYRADCLSKLTGSDIEKLGELGIACVIDLRHEEEINKTGHPVKNVGGIAYHNVQLVDGVNSNDLKSLLPQSLSEMYADLADNAGGKIAEIFRIILNHKVGGVVFHCAAGKDRTGVVAALLLLLAGAEETEILFDYSITYTLMKEVFSRQIQDAKNAGFDIPAHIFLSDEVTIKEFIDHIHHKHRGVENYLKSIGLDTDEIAEIKRIITEERE